MAKTPSALRDHFVGSYLALRWFLVFLAIVLPFVLWWGGQMTERTPLLGSMSAYYYHPLMGDAFVGILCAVGVLLLAYRGFSDRENWALNFACFFIVIVALEPTAPPRSGGGFLSVHGTAAIAFFLCIAYVCFFRAEDTLSLVSADKVRKTGHSAAWFRKRYKLAGIAMGASPIVAAALVYLLDSSSYVFLVETLGVWSFAAFWYFKSVEMMQTHADQSAAAGELSWNAKADKEFGRVARTAPVSVSDLSAQEARDVATWLGMEEAA